MMMSFPFKLAVVTAQVTYTFDHTPTHMHKPSAQIKMRIKGEIDGIAVKDCCK